MPVYDLWKGRGYAHLASDVRLGGRIGLTVGLAFAVITGVWNVLSGGASLQEVDSEFGSGSFWMVLLSYLAGGALGGLIVGVLLPVVRYAGGAVLAGGLGLIPVFVLLEVAMPNQGDSAGMGFSIATAIIIGCPSGYLVWRNLRRRGSGRRP